MQEVDDQHGRPVRLPEPGDKFYVPDSGVLGKWADLRRTMPLSAIVEMVRQDLDVSSLQAADRAPSEPMSPATEAAVYGALNQARRLLRGSGL